jgi:hypothetical protein
VRPSRYSGHATAVTRVPVRGGGLVVFLVVAINVGTIFWIFRSKLAKSNVE